MDAKTIATLAAIVASQALISGAFSLTQQAVQLGFAPRDAAVARLAAAEVARQRRDPRHRTAQPRLRRLAARHRGPPARCRRARIPTVSQPGPGFRGIRLCL